MQIPLDKLRFDPDPLGLNNGYQCDCLRCRTRRLLAEQLGVSEDSIVQLKLSPVDVGSAAFEAMKEWGAVNSQPLITAFDVHGSSPGQPAAADRDPEPASIALPTTIDNVGLPRPFVWTAKASALAVVLLVRACGFVLGNFRRFILAQPRLRVIADE
jgi:hypothetical protein